MNVPDPPAPRPGIVAEVERFAAEHHIAARAVELDAREEFPGAEFRAMGAAGLLGLSLSPELGGRGLSLPDTGAGLYYLARAGGTAFAKLALQPEFCSVLAEQGSAELVERYFRPLTRGELLVANQVTEPSAGSDAGALEMEARREGSHYVLTGVKSEAAFVQEAAAAIVYARTGWAEEGSAGISAFLVPQTLGERARSVRPDLGERWMGRGTVTYRGAKVPVANRVGEEGRAFDYLRGELTRERALLAAIYLGVARASWEETVAHVERRLAFGRPLSRQEAVAFPLVEDWARCDATWFYVANVLEQLDRGAQVDAQSALAKWTATECALTTIDHAIQFHGGRGYSGELPHERRWRDVRSGGIAHGPSEVMRLVASRSIWGARRRSPAPPDASPPEQ